MSESVIYKVDAETKVNGHVVRDYHFSSPDADSAAKEAMFCWVVYRFESVKIEKVRAEKEIADAVSNRS